jgi:hypothetical protein
MNKPDRAKMESRLDRSLPTVESLSFDRVAEFVALEVDRAVRAKRKTWRAAALERRRWVEVEREKNIGRKAK